ncbi:MAG: acyl carrier protein [Raoultibacter sp.]
METIETIKNILNENLGIAPDQVRGDSTFESLNIDSLDMVELVCTLEDTCNIDFGDPDDLETIDDLVAYVNELK